MLSEESLRVKQPLLTMSLEHFRELKESTIAPIFRYIIIMLLFFNANRSFHVRLTRPSKTTKISI